MSELQLSDTPDGPSARRSALPAAILLGSLALAFVFAGVGSTCEWVQLPVPSGQADWNMFDAIVHRVRSGEAYYAAFTTELLSRGYPNDRVFNWRLPALTFLLAALPDIEYARWIVIGLISVTLAFWFGALRQGYGNRHAIAGVVVLAVVLLPLTIPSVEFFAESWAGLLIVLSLGAFAAGLWPVSVAAGIAALCIRELALPYVLVMFLIATLKKHRHEQMAWLAGLVLFAGLFSVHRVMVSPYLGTSDPTNRWLVFGGPCFMTLTASHNAISVFIPGPLRASLVALALLGFTAWRDPAGFRAALTVLSYVLVFLAAGRPDNAYWGFVYSPVLFLGFVFVPAALADVAVAIRSIVATRMRNEPTE